AADYLRKRGSEVRVNQAASGISAEDGQIQGAWVNGALLEADYYLLAVPWDGLLELLPSPLTTDPFFARLSQLQASPIVNVHLWYDRPVVGIDFAAFLNTPMQWLFNKSRLWGQEEARGQYLDISLSGAYDFVDMPGQDLVHLFSREISAFFPAARTATPTSSLVVKQPNATFAARPGAARLRAGQRTPVPNLFLAGDWTDTGWPATMESAVRSGVLAAQAIIESEMKGGDSLSTTLASKRLQA
ncbi:MAG TPA: FAD-dependent oxidoreductase, partial [Dehalococcoidia bacterium]|nr:FAD-dependent oxidoreductase [Dehalococcoidia bacterium]